MTTKKIFTCVGWLVADVSLIAVYYCMEQLIPRIWAWEEVAAVMAISYLAALAAHLLTGKRHVKMIEWPAATMVGCFLLAIVKIIASKPPVV